MAQAVNSPDGVNPLNAVRDVDTRNQSVFTSVAEAIAGIPASKRVDGLKIDIKIGGNWKPYYWSSSENTFKMALSEDLAAKLDFNVYEEALDIDTGSWKDTLGISNIDNTSDVDKPISTATQQALNDKVDSNDYEEALNIDVGSWKDTLGISNIDNTSDVDKPISTATQQALNDKLDSSDYEDAIGIDVSTWKDTLEVNKTATPTADSNLAFTSGGAYDITVNKQFIKHPDLDFIKELYVTGWEAEELHLILFNANDNGKVTFRFRNATNGEHLIYTYQLDQNLEIYPLNTAGDASGSGFGGYLVVDWSKYTGVFNNQNTYIAPVNEKAKYLGNSPFIKCYLKSIEDRAYTDEQFGNTLSMAASFDKENETEPVSAKQVDGYISEVIYGEVVAESEMFLSTATHTELASINGFVTDIKAVDINDANLTNDLWLASVKDNGNGMLEFIIRDSSSTIRSYWLDDIQASGIYTFTTNQTADRISLLVTLDFDNAFYFTNTDGYTTLEKTPLNIQFLKDNVEGDGGLLKIVDDKIDDKIGNIGNIDDEIDSRIDNKIDTISYQNIYPDGDFSEGDTYTPHANNSNFQATSYSVTTDTNGMRIQITEYISSRLEFGKYGIDIEPNTRVVIIMNYKVNSTNIPIQGDKFLLNWFVGGNTDNVFFGDDNIREINNGKTFTEVQIMEFPSTITAAENKRIFFRTYMNGLEGQGIDVDITINSIQFIKIPSTNQSLPNYFEALNQNQYKEIHKAVKISDFALSHNNIYYGRQLITWGASTTENCVWQQIIANYFGMEFSVEMTQGAGIDGYTETAKGGSWLVPIATDNDTKALGSNSYQTIKDAFTYYDDLYTNEFGKPLHIFFIGHNSKDSGQKYTSESSFVVPADYGLSDTTPYEGGEIDLVSNPSESNLPTFGASYRGILKYCFEQRVDSDIMLMNLYTTQASDITKLNALNAVIDAMGEEFGLKVLNMRNLFNQYNEDYYLKDVIHQNKKGGEKQGREAVSQM